MHSPEHHRKKAEARQEALHHFHNSNASPYVNHRAEEKMEHGKKVTEQVEGSMKRGY